MGIWIFMVIMLLLIPIIMIVFGNKFIKSPPKQINGVYQTIILVGAIILTEKALKKTFDKDGNKV